ncbi:MAG: ATP-NAD kinase family protein [Candidatus Thermoplasmatota archaeon]
MTKKIGFLVNPIAGMGGRVGLKGTDGVVDQAITLGAQPLASKKAVEMLKKFLEIHPSKDDISWYTSTGTMGAKELTAVGITPSEIVYRPPSDKTTSLDTKKICRKFMEKKVDIILFCGGDGTARDIFDIVSNTIPILGIPAGVKMHSGVFGVSVQATAKILHGFLETSLIVGDAEIIDLDEELYRKGEWKLRLFGVAKGIIEPTYIQVGKTTYESISEESIKDELAEHIRDELDMNPDTLFFFGSGGTIDHVARKLGIENTLLGIDAVYQKRTIRKDLNETQILQLLSKYKKRKLLLSPIGSQGFILGRGNLQLSPPVIKQIGLDNIIIIATPAKLIDTPVLRVDTGDSNLDALFSRREYYMVVIGYRLSRVVKIQTNIF